MRKIVVQTSNADELIRRLNVIGPDLCKPAGGKNLFEVDTGSTEVHNLVYQIELEGLVKIVSVTA